MNSNASIKTIRLCGELEIGRKSEIRDALSRSGEERAILIDLSEVTYADSVALTELLRFCVECQRSGVAVALVIKTPQFARVVQYAGLASAFKTFDNSEGAVAYLSEHVQR